MPRERGKAGSVAEAAGTVRTRGLRSSHRRVRRFNAGSRLGVCQGREVAC